MHNPKRIAVVGGGASGASLLWSLTSQAGPRSEIDATLFHDEPEPGGHSRTVEICFDGDGHGRLATTTDAALGHAVYPVDIGVQFVCESLYPNLYRQLALSPFRDSVRLVRQPDLRMSGAFGPGRVWGNFPAYQVGSRFGACLDAETRATALRFQSDLGAAPLRRAGPRPLLRASVGEYLDATGIGQDSNFFRYLLVPYLSIVNGYGTTDLLETTMLDLYPIFSRLPGLQSDGPYASFTEPGRGWDRFTDGATRWIDAMLGFATLRGARVLTECPVELVIPEDRGVVIQWLDRRSGATRRGRFDAVVLTTDMNTNRRLLGDAANPHRTAQLELIAAERFPLLPGVCYVHQDPDLIAPELSDGLEDGQFCASFSPPSPGGAFGLPYDLESAFQNYSMQRILGTPGPCWVSMYAEHRAARLPAPDKTLFSRSWVHGRWVTSYFRRAKRELRRIQGLGNVWFAGNNTTMDSEEGALVSAMVIAERISSFRYPFPRLSSAFALYSWLRGTMFDASRRASLHPHARA